VLHTDDDDDNDDGETDILTLILNCVLPT